MVGSDRKRGCLGTSDIADIFSPTFTNPTFQFSPIVKYENLGYKNQRFSNIRLFNIRLYMQSNITTWFSKIRDLQTSIFSIFAFGQIRKLGCLKSKIFKHPSF